MDNGSKTEERHGAVGGPVKFTDGNPGGPGRPTGARNKRTIVREAVGGRALLERLENGDAALKLPPAYLRWIRLLKERNPFVRLAAEKFLYEALHGRPKQQVEVDSPFKVDVIAAIRRAAETARARRDAHLAEMRATVSTPPRPEVILPGDRDAREAQDKS